MWLCLALIFVLNALCFSMHPFYAVFFGLQVAFYLMAFIGYQMDKRGKKSGLFYLPYYYCNVNLAAFKGFLFFLKQRSTVDIWKKAQR
jgi:hypothetical protein